MNKYQDALNYLYGDSVDLNESLLVDYKLTQVWKEETEQFRETLQELVDKFELIKAISKQKHDYYREEWLRYGEYEDKGRCSVFSQILNLIGDDEDE